MGATQTYACERCHVPLQDQQPGTYVHLTSGWVKLRSAGGAHAVKLAVSDGRRLCGPCMDLSETEGEQLALFET